MKPKRLSLRKRLLFAAIVLIGIYAFIEVVSLGGLYFVAGGWSAVRVLRERQSQADILGTMIKTDDEVIHPYFGFVLQPDRVRDVDAGTPHVTEFGFVDTALPIQRRAADKIVVGIVGGSVAHHLSLHGTETLARELEKLPQFTGKQVEFVRLAIPGYKQPQQLIVMTYMLSLGAEFDALINLDGFNELVLPLNENIPNDVFASFPRSWHLRVTEGHDVTVLRLVGRVNYCRETRKQLSAWLASSPLRFSAFANLLWKSADESLTNALIKDHQALSTLGKRQVSFCATGPPQAFENEEARLNEAARYWKQCSVQLHQVCAANGIRYFHFLQPNQYVPDSKPIGAEERKVAVDDKAPFKSYVESGYPLLVRAGQSLAQQGINFHDLTQIFADHSERLYSDFCCHVNQRGNELLATEIGRHIHETWK